MKIFFSISSRSKIIASSFERNFFKSNIISDVTIEDLTIDEDYEIIWSTRFSWVRTLMRMKRMTLCTERFDVSKLFSLRIMSFIVKCSDWINLFILSIWFWRRTFFNSFDNCLERLLWCWSKLELRSKIMTVLAIDKENSFEMISEDNAVNFRTIDFWIFLLRFCFLLSCIRFSSLNRFFLNSCFFSDDLIIIASYVMNELMWWKSNDFFIESENCKKDEILRRRKKKKRMFL